MPIINFLITNPPYRRKRKISDNEYLYITPDKSWVAGTEIWEYTTAGCFTHPDNGSYETEDGYTITVLNNLISSISE